MPRVTVVAEPWAASSAATRIGLRSTVTGTHGDTSTTTVYNAYAVN